MSEKWVNTTAKDVVTISGSIWNDNTRTVANAVNYNAQILKDALNRIAELENVIKSKAESEERMKLIIDIPENEYEHIKEYYEKNDIVESTYSYIYHGIPHETVTEFADRCRECGREKVLDKIRAEIAEYKDDKIIHAERNEMIDIVLDIIDKYKAESEDKATQIIDKHIGD